jgi:signal transduction histidine kinase
VRRFTKIWLGAVGATLGAFVVAALILPQSFRLSLFCDVAETLLLFSGFASVLRLVFQARGRMRLFWSLISFGIGLWLSYQSLWTYYEVVLRRDVPDIFAGDVILFLNIVPLMAALALRPHVPRDEYSARLGQLDFALLLVWWLFLYVLTVIPWQYVEPNTPAYARNLNVVYTGEKVAFLVGLAACWYGSKGSWRKLYGSLFGMSFCYAFSSAFANWAIARKAYYSGSLYDIPLAVAMAWVTWIGLRTKTEAPQLDGHEVSTVYGVWVARCGMIAVFSLPLFAAWALSDHEIPSRIKVFRLGVTLLAALGMGTLVFLRQSLLDRELLRLLNHSHSSVASLHRLQAQILQSEKLASIGQLVGGAAHELNNPITAMLGYSELLLSTPLTNDQQSLATKIGHHVRRTKSLVASLISFARQGPAPKTAIDLNTLTRTAVKLSEPQLQSLKIAVHTNFDAALPKIVGDSNQILQVCLQLIGNCLHVMSEHRDGVLIVNTSRDSGICVVELHAAAANAGSNESATYGEEDLALSACRGILQEHHGSLTRKSTGNGTTVLRVELPAMEFPAALTVPTVPVLQQSQPFA